MKKSSLLLALGLVFFLGACSTMEEDFLNKVQGKTAYDHATSILPANSYGTFSSNGKSFTFTDDPTVLTFVKAIDENTGKYTSVDGTSVIVKTSDGKTGTINNETGTGPNEPLWFK